MPVSRVPEGSSARAAALGHSEHARPEEPGRPLPNVALKIAARFLRGGRVCRACRPGRSRGVGMSK